MISQEKGILGLLKEIVNSIYEIIHPKPLQYTIEEYLKILDPVVDEIIVEEQNKGAKYAGGTCYVSYDKMSPKKPIKVSLEMFFKNTTNNKWTKKSMVRNVEEKYFVPEVIKTLKSNEKIEFDISAPEENKIEGEV